MIRDTSTRAYHALSDLGERQKEVYMVIARLGSACNLDIAEELGLPINSVTPRTNELVFMDYVEEARKDIGPTGRTVIYWKIKRKEAPIDWEKMRLEVIQQRDRVDEDRSQLSIF